MSTIGTLVKRADSAYVGSLNIKSYGGKAFLKPNLDKATEAAPDFRLYGVGDHGNTFEAGAAWIKQRQSDSAEYVSIKIDFPELRTPIYATLGRMAGDAKPGAFAIIWNRPNEGRGASDPFAALASEPDPADDPVDDGPDVFGGLDREED
jgi:uncharacterized protein (DUF736 family)